MRILHTSDWHLGRVFHKLPLLGDQVSVLSSLVDVVRDEKIDVVVIAGDLFDRPSPSPEVVGTLGYLLGEIRGAGAQIVGISGNHDSPERVGFGESIMRSAGVALRGDLSLAATPQVIEATDGGPDLACYLIPYLEPSLARHTLGVPEIRSHDGLLRHALGHARKNLASSKQQLRSLAVAHAFVRSGTPCDSEQVLAVGGAAEVGLKCFEGFDYVALGHLHGAQTFGNGNVRYSGSPLAYSFSEKSHTKRCWIVDMAVDGTSEVTSVELPVARKLAVIEGSLQELLNSNQYAQHEDAFVRAVLCDIVPPLDAMARLRERFPFMAELQFPAPACSPEITTYRERTKERSDDELLFDFYAHVTGEQLAAEDRSFLLEMLHSDSDDHDAPHLKIQGVA